MVIHLSIGNQVSSMLKSLFICVGHDAGACPFTAPSAEMSDHYGSFAAQEILKPFQPSSFILTQADSFLSLLLMSIT
jgi:hypothetical protein